MKFKGAARNSCYEQALPQDELSSRKGGQAWARTLGVWIGILTPRKGLLFNKLFKFIKLKWTSMFSSLLALNFAIGSVMIALLAKHCSHIRLQ